jgi:hypothetical protein
MDDPRFTAMAGVDFTGFTLSRGAKWKPGDVRGGGAYASAPPGLVIAASHLGDRLWPAFQVDALHPEQATAPLRWADLKGREPDRVFLFAHDIAYVLGYEEQGVAAPQALRALYALTEVGVVERYYVLPTHVVAYFVSSWERVRAADAVLRLSGKRALKKWIAEQKGPDR